MDKLRDKDICKLSSITGISVAELTKMLAMSLINQPIAIDLLLVYDWKAMQKTRRYTVSQMIQALMEEYSVSRSKVQSAIYQKKKKLCYCPDCGKRTSKTELARNVGICDKCVVKSIHL